MSIFESALIAQQAVAQLLGFKTLAIIYLPNSIVQQAVAQLVRVPDMVIGQQLVAQMGKL